MATATSRSKTANEWAEELGCHVETLRLAIRHKELLATRDPLRRGRPWMIRADDMKAFLDKRRVGR